jgi:hypothetical protein
LKGEHVIIIHPSARDWKLFMYENNDVRRKKNLFLKVIRGQKTSQQGQMHLTWMSLKVRWNYSAKRTFSFQSRPTLPHINSRRNFSTLFFLIYNFMMIFFLLFHSQSAPMKKKRHFRMS